jgi:hypothetical protein
MNCDFCNTNFKNISSLNHHKKTAKFCLKIQDKYINEIYKDFKCDLCDKLFTTKQSLNNHLISCKIFIKQKKDDELQKLLYEQKEKFKNIIKNKDIIIDKLEFIREKNIEHNKKQEELYISQEKKIKDLQDQIQKLALRAIDRPTNSINKLELNNFITPENIEDKIQRKFNDNFIPNGIKDVAKFVYEWILKTEEGDLIYACYDRARLIFKYKDTNGNEMKDPKALELCKLLKPGLVKKLSEMLNYFTTEFEYINSRKERDLEYDKKEYNTFKFLKEKALELGFELTTMNETNKFCNELANLTIV